MVTSLQPNTPAFDADLQSRVRNYLHSQSRSSLRVIQVEAERGVITLRGQVNSYYEKQLSWHLAGRVAGVRRLVDELVVQHAPAGY